MNYRVPHFPCSWNSFCCGLGILFVIRGLILLCLYPPLEGFDEHQHIAYLQYIGEHGGPPHYGDSYIPKSLYQDFVSSPHSDYGWQQLRGIGARRYKDFWSAEGAVRYDHDVLLGASFHPPLYYFLASPVFIFLRSHAGFLAAVYFLRIVNIIIAGCAIGVFALPLRRLFRQEALSRLAALTISLLPMYTVYVARVSCDSLALLFSAALFALMANISDGRSLYRRSLLLGVMIGAGSLTRSSVSVFLPIGLILYLFLCINRRISARQLLLASLLLLGSCALLTWRYYMGNLQLYGVIIPGQESIAVARQGKGFIHLLNAIHLRHVWDFFTVRMILVNLWMSGWSFLFPPTAFYIVYLVMILVSLLGIPVGVTRIMRGEGNLEFPQLRLMFFFALVWIMTCIGAYLHALCASVAYASAHIYSLPYYALPGYAAFLAFVLGSLNGYGNRRLWMACAALFLCLFIVTEFYGLFAIAVPYWTSTHKIGEIYRRLSFIHPAFPSPRFLPLFLVLYIIALAIIARSIGRVQRESAPRD
ncbi:MAG: DUF2142 domain-containing protein [Candidatus Aureabacteria bacterium]|nr:DUF2142 domain-containing protein [Candidatus Auribacterota bacterium]